MSGRNASEPSLLRHDETVGRIRFVVTGAASLAVTEPAHARARADVATSLGLSPDRLLLPHQVHSDRVIAVDGPWPGRAPEVDGLVVSVPGTAAGVLAADCMPLLLGDAEGGLAAAVHVGRRGLAADIAGRAVSLLARLGAGRLVARIGPTVCGRCYEVPETMQADVAAQVPESAARTRQGTPSIDIVAGVRAQLQRSDLPVQVDESWSACTLEDPSLFSHRRDGTLARHAGIVLVTGAAR